MGTNLKLFFMVTATILIALSFILIYAAMMFSYETGNMDTEKYEMTKAIFISSLAILFAAFVAKYIFKKNIFVTYLCFTIIIFLIASVLYVDSFEKKREYELKGKIIRLSKE